MRRVLEAAGIRYALIGGHALAARGYPRFTIDIDLLTTDVAVLDAADLILLKLAAGGGLDMRDAAALLATDRDGLKATVESRLAAAAIGPDATACWQQVLALPA